MSEIKHRLNIGACTKVDIDGSYTKTLLPPFTADMTTIFADSTIRFADETK